MASQRGPPDLDPAKSGAEVGCLASISAEGASRPRSGQGRRGRGRRRRSGERRSMTTCACFSSLGSSNNKVSRLIFNILGAKYITIDGLALVCAKVTEFCLQIVGFRFCLLLNTLIWIWLSASMQAGGVPDPELVHYNPKNFYFGKMAFPFRDYVPPLFGFQTKKETVTTDKVCCVSYLARFWYHLWQFMTYKYLCKIQFSSKQNGH